MVLSYPHTRRGSRLSLCLLIGIGLFWGVPLIAAQQQEPLDVVSVRTDLVAIPVRVTDSHGRHVPNLSQQDFAIADEGRAVRIDYFASGAERIALAFVLDNSGSVREELARQSEAALGLFSRFGPASRVAVIRFGLHARVVAPFTRDAESARTAFNIPVNLSERTAIFDAALAAVQAYGSGPENSSERRIAILISDGLDTASRSNASEVIDTANRMNVSFYVIQFPLFTPRDGRLAPRPAAKGFRDLAQRTGGRLFVAGGSPLNQDAAIDLAPVFAAIEEDLKSQYVVGFYPDSTSRDGKSHRAIVTVSDRKMKVRQLRTSYSLKPK